MTTRTVQLPNVCLSASLAASGEDRRAKVVFYSGAGVERSSFDLGDYSMKFSLEKAAVKLGRMNAGAPLTRDHSRALSDQVGVVEKAWLEGGAARAVVRFSARPEIDALWQDVKAGVIRNVSMEAAISELAETTPRGASQRTYLATKWAPVALSIVSVPADAGASFHASEHPTHECVIREKDDTMTIDTDTDTTDPTPEERLAEKTRKVALAREGQIHRLAKAFSCGDLWAARMIATDLSTDEILEQAAEARAKRAPQMINDIGFGHDYDSPGERLEMMAEGIVSRATHTEPAEAGRRYADATLVELAHECLSLRGFGRGLDVRRHGARIIHEALAAHHTSDFPLLLGNALNKLLLPGYEDAAPTFRAIATPKDFNDFREHKYLRAGDFPVPLLVNESGEIHYGTMSEHQEVATLATYGRIFAITRQVLINDDLGAFSELATAAARRVASLHNSLFFAACITPASGLGPNMSDGVAFFNSAHGNVTAGGLLSVTTLGAARALMMVQTSSDGLKLNVRPSVLLVSPASLTVAEQLVSEIAPAQVSDANPFAGKLTVVGDSNLSGARFYLIAAPAQLPAFTYGFLSGAGPLRFETRVGFEVEGVEVKVATDFGAACLESRAAVTGAGS